MEMSSTASHHARAFSSWFGPGSAIRSTENHDPWLHVSFAFEQWQDTRLRCVHDDLFASTERRCKRREDAKKTWFPPQVAAQATTTCGVWHVSHTTRSGSTSLRPQRITAAAMRRLTVLACLIFHSCIWTCSDS